MADQWIIRVEGKEYGPADLATLRDWKADGRVLPSNPARRADVDLWKTAGEIPGLFRVERPPIQQEVTDQQSAISNQQSGSKPPGRNVLLETFRIYFRGFFQFFGLTLLAALPSICGRVVSVMIQTRSDLNADLRTMVVQAFVSCMFVLTLVLWPIYVAGIQILTAELSSGRRVSFFTVLNHAVKYWPRVAGLCIFVYLVFILIIAFGLAVLSMTVAAGVSGSFFWTLIVLGLALLQLWLFCRFFVFTLFWQQFAVLENLPAFEALRESSRLAHSGGNLPRHQRPLWRAALIASIWVAFLIGIALAAVWPRLVAEWPTIQDYVSQLAQSQDPQAVLQKFNASLPASHGLDLRELIFNGIERIFQPLLGIAFVVLYLDSKLGRES